MSKTLRFPVFVASTDPFKEQTLGNTPGLFQGSPATLDFAFFDSLAALIDITGYTDITLEVWVDQQNGARVLEETIAAADFDPTTTKETWNAKTKAQVRFDLTGTQLNFEIASGTSKNFYMVVGGTPVGGEPETLGYSNLKLIKDRFGEPGETVEADPASYLTAAQSDARYVPFTGEAGFKFEDGYLQLRDTVTGGWRGLFLASGALSLTAESPAAELTDYYRFAGNYLQLKDSITAGWRTLFISSGALAVGEEESV